jgi:hypothetical protein
MGQYMLICTNSIADKIVLMNLMGHKIPPGKIYVKILNIWGLLPWQQVLMDRRSLE